MNRRQWKKRCKKAAVELERRWPGEFVIEPAKGDETVDAPRHYEPPDRDRLSRRYAEAPKGAPGVWQQVSYECNEWDFFTADQMLAFMVFACDTDWDAIARAEGLLEAAA